MKYFQWTIGSTTVRNPDRLRDGLRILKDDFESKEWNVHRQEKFFDFLKQKGVYEMEEENYRQMTSARKQEHARKWVSILNQLGFCFAYESSGKPVIITKVGNALLNYPEIENEIFLRQLLKYQKPCALPKQNGEAFKGISVLPFITSLKIANILCGLSKEEISIFLLTTVRMDQINKVIDKIRKYRAEKGKIEGRVKRKEFYFKTQLARLEEVFKDEVKERNNLIRQLVAGFKKSRDFLTTTNGKKLLLEITKGGKGSKTVKAIRTRILIIAALKKGKSARTIKKVFWDYYLSLKISTLRDYADLTARYLRKSGLFSVNRDRLVTISDKEDLIKSLLAQKWTLVTDKNYLQYLWSDTLPELPSDKMEYLKKHLKAIAKKERALFDKVGARESLELVGTKIPTAKTLLELEKQTKSVETNLLHLKEIEFYYAQRDEKQIEDILNFYSLILNKEILGGEAYYPAYLEWNTWRVFLAIDALSNKPFEARNFKIDDELQPINSAPGNRADMVFEYDDFVLVTEVTLSTRANQWSAEAEPVPRHVAQVQFLNKNKNVFGIFVAPEIDVNTVLTFFNNRKYSINDKIITLTIIPLTIEQVKFILVTFKDKRFSTEDMKRLFEIIRFEMTKSKDALGWYKKIPLSINDWTQAL